MDIGLPFWRKTFGKRPTSTKQSIFGDSATVRGEAARMQIVLPKWIFSSHFQFGRALDLSGQKGHSYASIHGLRTYPWFEDALYRSFQNTVFFKMYRCEFQNPKIDCSRFPEKRPGKTKANRKHGRERMVVVWTKSEGVSSRTYGCIPTLLRL